MAARPCHDCDPGKNCCNSERAHKRKNLTRHNRRSKISTAAKFRACRQLGSTSASPTSSPPLAPIFHTRGEDRKSLPKEIIAKAPSQSIGGVYFSASSTASTPMGTANAQPARGVAAVDPPKAGDGGNGRQAGSNTSIGGGKWGSLMKGAKQRAKNDAARQAMTTRGGPPGSHESWHCEQGDSPCWQ